MPPRCLPCARRPAVLDRVFGIQPDSLQRLTCVGNGPPVARTSMADASHGRPGPPDGFSCHFLLMPRGVGPLLVRRLPMFYPCTAIVDCLVRRFATVVPIV